MSNRSAPHIHRLTFLSLVAGLSSACTAQTPMKSGEQTASAEQALAVADVDASLAETPADLGGIPASNPFPEPSTVDDVEAQDPEKAPEDDQTKVEDPGSEPSEMDLEVNDADLLLADACHPKLAPENCSDAEWDAWNAGE